MQRQNPQLGLERVARLSGLPARDAGGNHDIAEVAGILAGERQDVRCTEFAPVTVIQRANAGVGDDGDSDCSASTGGCHRRQPCTQSRRAHVGRSDDIDCQPAVLGRLGASGRPGPASSHPLEREPFENASVRLDDVLYQLVPHDVLLVEVDEPDPVHVLHDLQHFDKTRHAGVGEIDLSDVARYNRFGTEPEPGEKHLHLFGRGVLRLVENHERVVQRTPAHERQRRDLYYAALEKPHRTFRVHHVEQRVVKRSKIRVHLLLQVAGKKAELLASFNRRSRENDAADLLVDQVADGLRHRQIRLAGTCWPDAEHDVELLDRIEIPALIDTLWIHAPSRGRPLRSFAEIAAQINIGVFDDELGCRLHVAVLEREAFGQERTELVEDPLGTLFVGRIAFNGQLGSMCAYVNVEQRFDVLEVGVVRSIERFNTLFGQGNLSHFLVDRCNSLS